MEQSSKDLSELAELAEIDDDNATLDEIALQLNELQSSVKHAELEALLSSYYANGSCNLHPMRRTD